MFKKLKIASVTFALCAIAFYGVLGFSSGVQAQSQDEINDLRRSCVESGGRFVEETLECIPASTTQVDNQPCEPKGSILGLPTWYKYLPSTTDAGGKCRPTLDTNDPSNGAKQALAIGIAILEIMMRFAGVFAVVFIMIGAFRYITSQGDPDSVKAAKNTIINAIVGLVLVLISTAIVNFIGNNIFAG